jgi:predicted RNA-binding Zn-ribbon protein involved in translation (DUF1610 family)
MSLAFLKVASPAMSVKKILHQSLAGNEDPRPHFPLRASDTTSTRHDFCPREHALLDMGQGKKKPSFVGTSNRLTYDHGKDTEKRIRNAYLRSKAVGQWRCGVCGYVTETLTKVPVYKCPTCGWGHLWEYHEPRFESAYSGISGGIDLLLDMGKPKLVPVELKTMASDEFKTLVAPLGEHRYRSSLYLRLIDESPWGPSIKVDTSEMKLLYASKGFGIKDESLRKEGIRDMPFTPFKEYIIKRDDKLTDNIVARARALKLWRDNPKHGLPSGVCTNSMTKQAQGCSTCAACFSGKFPSFITWIENGAPRHPGKKVLE